MLCLLIAPVIYSLFDDLHGGRAFAGVSLPVGKRRGRFARGIQRACGRLTNGGRPS